MISPGDKVEEGGAVAGAAPDKPNDRPRFDAAGIEAILKTEMAESQAPGAVLAIVRAEEELHLKGYGKAHRVDCVSAPVTPETLFRIGSVTKMFVSATGVLLDRAGVLDLDAPVEALVPDLAGSRLRATATVRMLLNHNGGMMERLADNGPTDDAHLVLQVLAYDDALQILPAASVFSYSAPGYNLAGLAIERAASVPFADAVARHLLDPLGMDRSGFRPEKIRQGDYTEGHGVDDKGAILMRPYVNNAEDWPDGFLATSGAEMSRFLRTLLGRGVLDGQQRLPAEVVEELLTPQVQLPVQSRVEQDFQRGPSYGFGWFHDTYRGIRVLHHSGWISGFGAMAILVPNHDLAAFAATSQDNQHLPRTLRAVLDAMLPVGPINKETLKLSDVPPSLRVELTGRYSNPGRATFQLREDSGVFTRVDVDEHGVELGSSPLMFAGKDRLMMLAPDGSPLRELEIVRNGDGAVQSLFDEVFSVPVLSEQ